MVSQAIRTGQVVYSVQTLPDGDMGDLMVMRNEAQDFKRFAITDGLIVSDPFLTGAGVEWRCQLIHVSTEVEIIFTVVASSGMFNDAIAVVNSSPILKSLRASGWLLGVPWLVRGNEF